MAKRANPYCEDFVQQSKMHIGLKQFNNNEDRLSKVYEKTLQLLFKGAKKVQNQEELHSCHTNGIEGKDGMKQLFIGNDGKLSHSGIMKQTAVEKSLVAQHCACSGLKVDSCAYCEAAVCALCQHCCVICHYSYCNKCSLIGHEGEEICVSCYS